MPEKRRRCEADRVRPASARLIRFRIPTAFLPAARGCHKGPALGKPSDFGLRRQVAALKKLGSAPAPGAAADALVRRRERTRASSPRSFPEHGPPAIPPSHEPSVHLNHRLTLRLATILPLLGERAGVRADLSRRSQAKADVSSSRRDWLPPRFRVREQFPSEQATSHEPCPAIGARPSPGAATSDRTQRQEFPNKPPPANPPL
jgi:hypothetical protein